MIIIIYLKMLTNMTDEAGDDAEKKVEVTAIPTAPATPPTKACLPLWIKEDKPTRPDLLRSRAVLRWSEPFECKCLATPHMFHPTIPFEL